jgi:hypothetical protein
MTRNRKPLALGDRVMLGLFGLVTAIMFIALPSLLALAARHLR